MTTLEVAPEGDPATDETSQDLEDRQSGGPGREDSSVADKDAVLLKLLESRQGTAVGRDEIARALWPETSFDVIAESREIDKAVLRLRHHLHDDPRRPKRLITAGDYGYLLV